MVAASWAVALSVVAIVLERTIDHAQWWLPVVVALAVIVGFVVSHRDLADRWRQIRVELDRTRGDLEVERNVALHELHDETLVHKSSIATKAEDLLARLASQAEALAKHCAEGLAHLTRAAEQLSARLADQGEAARRLADESAASALAATLTEIRAQGQAQVTSLATSAEAAAKQYEESLLRLRQATDELNARLVDQGEAVRVLAHESAERARDSAVAEIHAQSQTHVSSLAEAAESAAKQYEESLARLKQASEDLSDRLAEPSHMRFLDPDSVPSAIGVEVHVPPEKGDAAAKAVSTAPPNFDQVALSVIRAAYFLVFQASQVRTPTTEHTMRKALAELNRLMDLVIPSADERERFVHQLRRDLAPGHYGPSRGQRPVSRSTV